MYHIHLTEEFRESINKDPREPLVLKRLVELPMIENPENLNSYDKYSKGILALKLKKSNSCRVVIQPKVVVVGEGEEKEEIKVYFVRAFIGKKRFDYLWASTTHPQLSKGEWDELHPLPDAEIKAFKNSFLKDRKNFPQTSSPPPSELNSWLDQFRIDLNFDVYERQNWVEYANDRTIKGLHDQWIKIFEEVFKRLLNDSRNEELSIEPIENSQHLFQAVDRRYKVGVIFHQMIVGNSKILIIHDGASLDNQPERWEKAKAYAINSIGRLASLEDVSRDAFRAYPKWILKTEMWAAIQRHEGTNNLSLLPEQVDFLRDFRFPSYIKGQAGSGKSTMMYYLFANVYFYFQGDSIPGEIVFLTENEELLENTRQAVIGLLSDNPEFNLDLDLEVQSAIRSKFCSFKEFLLRILPEDERESFPNHRYLDFSKFKSVYSSDHNRRYSAEEVWFVITTYIAGYHESHLIDSVSKYTDPTLGVPRDFRLISEEYFENILQEALPVYNRLIENGFWDKIHLVRRIREVFPEKLPLRYTAVFCDEAQDFSRIELRLIIDSSIYTDYDLSRSSQIPIVIAGDAMQTVSPTGFSDTRLHQMYFETFLDKGFDYDKSSSTYDPTYNYRSIEAIVKIANGIQNFRKIGLNEGDAIRQKAKRIGTPLQKPIIHKKEWISQEPQFNEFVSKFRFKAFIVPVDLDGEETYVNSDPILQKDHFKNIKSSISAKGSEYSQVVIWGFGDQFLDEFERFSWQTDNSNFRKKFFFNKLYVAITRAQNELVIIDSELAIEKFWTPLLQIPPSFSNQAWEHYDELSALILINPESGLKNIEESSADDALNNAKIDLELGWKDRNASRLLVARSIFLVLDQMEKAYECEARISEIREQYEKAGRNWEKAKDYQNAFRVYFEGRVWEKFGQISKRVEGRENEARILVSTLLRSSEWTEDEVLLANQIRGAIDQVIRLLPWRVEFMSTLSSFAQKEHGQQMVRDMAYIIDALIIDADSDLWKVLGDLYFSTKQFDQAIIAWDSYLFDNPDLNPFRDYLLAKIESSIDSRIQYDEILWKGRLLSLESNQSERVRLAREILKYTSENESTIENSEVNQEWVAITHYSNIVLNNLEETLVLATTIERNLSADLGNLVNHFAKCVGLASSESLAIFLKERWAKASFQLQIIEFGEEAAIDRVNKSFIEADFSYPGSNSPWSKEEILNISETPEPHLQSPSGHIQNVSIVNFKKFENISISNIGQYNLILGDNNTGKTTLLESLMFSPNPDECLRNILYAEYQRNNRANELRGELFFDRILDFNAKKRKIVFKIRNGRRSWEYVLRNPSLDELVQQYGTESVDFRKHLAIDSHVGIEISQPIELIENDLNAPENFGRVPLVPFGKGYSENLAAVYLSSIGEKRSARKEFIEQLRLFIPQLVEITADSGKGQIMITEEIEGKDRLLPLHAYGEGANKLFRILVQLHISANSRLMIDEIDAGIHYSRMKQFWQIILRSAEHYNVQLFSTTHNEECITSFWDALNASSFELFRPKSRIITLERHSQEDKIVPIVRNWDGIRYAYEHHLETRGRK